MELKAEIFIWNCFVLRVEGLGGECVLRIWRLRLCELRVLGCGRGIVASYLGHSLFGFGKVSG